MAKPKSMKLRSLITLFVLYKHTDAEHRLHSTKLNEFLRPYGLECTGRALSDTVNVLREYGIDVRSKGVWDNQGVWIEDHPLPLHELKRLIFAVSTNPHLSKAQATDILQSLKPLVTIYQEDLLRGMVDTGIIEELDDSLYWTYLVIHEAISAQRRVRYSVDYTKYNADTQSVKTISEWATLFTPKCIYQSDGELYMVGYNNTDRHADAVNLKDISSIKLAYKHKDPKADMVNQWVKDIEPQDHIPGKCTRFIYEGPAVFVCRGQYVGELLRRFGPPDGPVIKDARCRTTYAVKQTQISSETLFWLSQIPDYGVRIKGPAALTGAVEGYFKETSAKLLNPTILAKTKR